MMFKKINLIIMCTYFFAILPSYSIVQYKLQLFVSEISVYQPKECMKNPKCFKIKFMAEFDGKRMSPTDGHTVDLRSLENGPQVSPTKAIYNGITDKIFVLDIMLDRFNEEKPIRLTIDDKEIVKTLDLTTSKPELKSFEVTGLGFQRNISLEYSVWSSSETDLSNALNAKCTPRDDATGHYTCSDDGEKICNENYTNPDNDCKDLDNCHKIDCSGNGNCSKELQKCICYKEYFGENCETRMTICLYDNPCNKKEQECIDLVNENKTRCDCKLGYYGPKCRLKRGGSCSEEITCENHGECRDLGGSLFCVCADQFEGKYCENDKNECLQKPKYCPFARNCSNTFGGYQCDCERPAYGENCDKCEFQLDENGNCSPSFNSKLFLPAVILAMMMIIGSSILSVHLWRNAVKSAKLSTVLNLGRLFQQCSQVDA